MELQTLTVDEEQRLFELYVLDCEQTGTKADLSYFMVWIEERY